MNFFSLALIRAIAASLTLATAHEPPRPPQVTPLKPKVEFTTRTDGAALIVTTRCWGMVTGEPAECLVK